MSVQVQEVKENSVVLKTENGIIDMPCGMVVWAAVRSYQFTGP